MKKENKKMAQEKRAAERKKEARKNVMKKVGMVCLPILTLVVLFFIGTYDFSADKDASETTIASAESTTASTPTLLTDSSLEVKDGDTIYLDYVGSVDGVEFEGGNTQGMGTDLVIGSGSYIDDFEEQLIGSHPGDEVDVVVTFPDNYKEKSLAGKEALFKCTVNGIYE